MMDYEQKMNLINLGIIKIKDALEFLERLKKGLEEEE